VRRTSAAGHSDAGSASESIDETTGTIRINGQPRLIQITPQQTASKPGFPGPLARIHLRDGDGHRQGQYLLVEESKPNSACGRPTARMEQSSGPHRLTDQPGGSLQPAGTAQAAFAFGAQLPKGLRQ
jgi:hypothetical protein